MFKCKEGCGECCGNVPLMTEMWNRCKHRIQRKIVEVIGNEVWVVPMTEDGLCCFLNKDKECAVYEDRPDVCRKYGIDKEKLPCPYFKPNGNPWSEAKAKQIRKKIDRDVDEAMRIVGVKL